MSASQPSPILRAEPATGAQIVAKAREYLGTPYHHQGRRKGLGVDCVGLLTGVGVELGLEVHDHVSYSLRPQGKQLLRYVARSCDQVAVDQRQLGDLLVFTFIGPGWPQHAALLSDYHLGGEGMIHTYRDAGKVVEHALDAYWLSKLDSVWRYRWRR